MSDWGGFWLFVAVWITVEAWVFTTGRDTFFYTHKTDAEKQLQAAVIEHTKGVDELLLERVAMRCKVEGSE